MINSIKDTHDKELTKQDIDNLFYELNKALRKKFKRQPKYFKAELYVVGGACVVANLQSRASTTDIDALWSIGSEMREAINEVGDYLNLGHTWCNCDFKRTKSYTNAIISNSYIYREYDRLVVRMVNLDLLLAMKLVAFRQHKITDKYDCINIINALKQNGIQVNSLTLKNLIINYYGTTDILSEEAKTFIGI